MESTDTMKQSDYASNGVNGDSAYLSASVCRDYLRNVCKRGVHCRYWHPSSDLSANGIVFCHDFQNAGCRRSGCKFVHCSREEEDVYRRTGQLQATACQNTTSALTSGVDVPICKDYLKGECRRGVKCKYEHLNESGAALSTSDSLINGSPFSAGGAVKMRRTELTTEAEMELVPLADYRAVEEENRILRRDVDELRRTVGVLVAANELLLEHNVRFRSSSAPVSQMIAAPTVRASSSAVAAISHIAIDGSSGLVVAQQPVSAAPVATLHPCVTATATLHPVMTATARLHPIATATLHPVGTATLHPSATATLHSVVTRSIVSAPAIPVDSSPGSVAIGVPSHAIVPVTFAMTALPKAPIASSLSTSASSTYVTYPIMSNGTHMGTC